MNLKVEVILGKECNLDCKYCNNKIMKVGTLSKDEDIDIYVLEFLKRVPNQIAFYGGEPLLHWDRIVRIIEYTDCDRFKIVTNGYYLDEEKVNFLNKYNVDVVLSWDGHLSTARNYDVIKDNKSNILKIDNLMITSVITTQNYLKSFLDELEDVEKEYFDIHNKYFDIYAVVVNESDQFDIKDIKELFEFDLNRLNREAQYVCDHYNDKISYKVFINTLKLLYDFETVKNVPGCLYGYNRIAIDLKGNYYACLDLDLSYINDKNIINTSVTDALNLINKVDKYPSRYEDMCKKCNVIDICKHGCSYLSKEQLETTYCPPRKALYTPIIEFLNKLEDEE